MKVIQANSFVNCILKSIRFYMPSSKIFSTVAKSDAMREFIFIIMVEKYVFFMRIQIKLDYSIRKTLIILSVGTL